MKIQKKNRKFFDGIKKNIVMKNVAKIFLKKNEHITFSTNDNKEYDFSKKDWGFYGTPSLNNRLKRFGYEAALVKNKNFGGKYTVLIVENTKKKLFNKYIKTEGMNIICWLNINNLKKIEKYFK